MKRKVTYKEIADYLGKSEGTIKNWKANHPELLEVVKLGMMCRVNNIDQIKLSKMIDLYEIISQERL
jgi:predicted transcriptional regulator